MACAGLQRGLAACAFGLLLALVSTSIVTAQRRPTEAVRLYERARERYAAEDYTGAAALLERAVALDPDSSTLAYNLARAYEMAGDRVRAEAYFQRVVETTTPGNDDHQQAVEGLARLRGPASPIGPATATPVNAATLPSQPTTPTTAPVVTPPVSTGVDQRFDAWFYLTLIGGGVAAAGALAFGVLAWSTYAEFNGFVIGRDGENTARDQKGVNAQNYAFISDILTGVGSAMWITTLCLVLFRAGPQTASAHNAHPNSRVAPAEFAWQVHAGPTGVGVSGTF